MAVAGGFGGGGTSRGRIQLFLVPKDQRERSSDQIAFDLRRQLSGIPGVIVRANASGGNNQLNRLMSGGQGNDSRMGVEIRGEDLEDRRVDSRRKFRTCSRPRRALPIHGSRAMKRVPSSPCRSIVPKRRCSA